MCADDAMAILAAFNSEEVEVIGITTIFGNVKTSTATDNAFILLSLAGCPEVHRLLQVGAGPDAPQPVPDACVKSRCPWRRAPRHH